MEKRERREREKWRREREEKERNGEERKRRRKTFKESGIKYRPMVEWNGLCDQVSNSIHMKWNLISP